jgi:hypothetical protein
LAPTRTNTSVHQRNVGIKLFVPLGHLFNAYIFHRTRWIGRSTKDSKIAKLLYFT